MAYAGAWKAPVGVVLPGEDNSARRDPLTNVYTVVLGKPGQKKVRSALGYLSGSLFEIDWVGDYVETPTDPKA